MRPHPHRSLFFFGLIAAIVLLTSCRRPPPPQPPKEYHGPPDLVQPGKHDPRWRAYKLGLFQLNHVWGGTGHRADGGDYRAKVTVWDDAPKDNKVIAELFFHDTPLADAPANPDPNKSLAPHRLNFPGNTLGTVMQALRNSNEAVYLYYYDDQWSLGVISREIVGVD